MLANSAARNRCKRGDRMRNRVRPCRGARISTISTTWVAKRSHTTSSTGRLSTSHLAQVSSTAKQTVASVTKAMPTRRLLALSVFSTGRGTGSFEDASRR